MLLLLTLAPTLPVSTVYEPRFAVLSAMVLSVGLLLSLRSSKLRVVASSIVLLLLLLSNRREWRFDLLRSSRMSAEARHAVYGDAEKVLWKPLTPPATLGELAWLRGARRRTGNPRWLYDGHALCDDDARSAFAVWSANVRRVVDATAAVHEELTKDCARVDARSPMAVQFSRDDGVLVWEIAPEAEENQYAFLLGGGAHLFEAFPRGRFQIGDADLSLRVGIVHPDGRRSYSESLRLPPEGSSMKWSRGGSVE